MGGDLNRVQRSLQGCCGKGHSRVSHGSGFIRNREICRSDMAKFGAVVQALEKVGIGLGARSEKFAGVTGQILGEAFLQRWSPSSW